MEYCEQIEYKGKMINIYHDELTESPRDTGFHIFAKMICFHRRYKLGDAHQYKEPTDLLYALASNKVWYDLEYKGMDELMRIVEKYYYILPLYLYDHSGITMRTSPFSCQWDSGQVGWIYIDKRDAAKEYGIKKIRPSHREKIFQLMEAEVQEYDCFLRGAVYGYSIDYAEGDACGGFIGDDHEQSGLMESAREFIDHVERREKMKILDIEAPQ